MTKLHPTPTAEDIRATYKGAGLMADGHPKTATLRRFLAAEGPAGTGRVVGFSIEEDGVFIYTRAAEWCDDSGAGTFRGDSETKAVKAFRVNVTPGNGCLINPNPGAFGPCQCERCKSGAHAVTSAAKDETAPAMAEHETHTTVYQNSAPEDARPLGTLLRARATTRNVAAFTLYDLEGEKIASWGQCPSLGMVRRAFLSHYADVTALRAAAPEMPIISDYTPEVEAATLETPERNDSALARATGDDLPGTLAASVDGGRAARAAEDVARLSEVVPPELAAESVARVTGLGDDPEFLNRVAEMEKDRAHDPDPEDAPTLADVAESFAETAAERDSLKGEALRDALKREATAHARGFDGAATPEAIAARLKATLANIATGHRWNGKPLSEGPAAPTDEELESLERLADLPRIEYPRPGEMGAPIAADRYRKTVFATYCAISDLYPMPMRQQAVISARRLGVTVRTSREGFNVYPTDAPHMGLSADSPATALFLAECIAQDRAHNRVSLSGRPTLRTVAEVIARRTEIAFNAPAGAIVVDVAPEIPGGDPFATFSHAGHKYRGRIKTGESRALIAAKMAAAAESLGYDILHRARMASPAATCDSCGADVDAKDFAAGVCPHCPEDVESALVAAPEAPEGLSEEAIRFGQEYAQPAPKWFPDRAAQFAKDCRARKEGDSDAMPRASGAFGHLANGYAEERRAETLTGAAKADALDSAARAFEFAAGDNGPALKVRAAGLMVRAIEVRKDTARGLVAGAYDKAAMAPRPDYGNPAATPAESYGRAQVFFEAARDLMRATELFPENPHWAAAARSYQEQAESLIRLCGPDPKDVAEAITLARDLSRANVARRAEQDS